MSNTALVPVSHQDISFPTAPSLPFLIQSAGSPAINAWNNFFNGKLHNENTRSAYSRAISQFMDWCETKEIELRHVMTGDVGRFLREHLGGIVTKKHHLSALRRFFNLLVERHINMINPAAVAETECHQVLEGKTPEITIIQARRLMASIEIDTVVGLRDRSIIATLIYTAACAGAFANLQVENFYHAGDQYCLRFTEKDGKSREIPVRHDLERNIKEYVQAAGVKDALKGSPLFLIAIRKEKRLTQTSMTGHDICRMVKHRMKRVGLTDRLTPHSFRVTASTELLNRGVFLEDGQRLLGHADPCTTRLYDRREKRVTRNIVERISVLRYRLSVNFLSLYQNQVCSF